MPDTLYAPEALLTVTVRHPNGKAITREIGMTLESFGEINWRDVEMSQIHGEVIALQAGAGPDARERLSEVMKRHATGATMRKRCEVIEIAVGKIARSIAEEMGNLESDAYSAWNMPPRAAG